MKLKFWLGYVLFLVLGFFEQAFAQVTIESAQFTGEFSSSFDQNTGITSFSEVSISGDFGLVLNLSPIPVTFNGSVSSSWADEANWSGAGLHITNAAQTGIDVYNAAAGGPIPAVAVFFEDTYDSLYVDGGPTEKLVTAPLAKFEWTPTSLSGFTASTELQAGLNVKFDVTVPSGKTAVMDQSPVVLENLTNAGNLTGNGNGLTINQNLQNTGILQGFGGSVAGNFTNSNGASATITGALSVQGDFQNTGTLIIAENGSLSRSAATTNNGTITLQGGQLLLPGGLTNNGVLGGYTGGYIGINIQNYGTITANVSNQQLTIADSGTFSPTIDNYGSMTATNGGILALSSVTVNAGTITANNGSVSMSSVVVNGSTFNGGISDLFTVNGNFNQIVNNAHVLSYSGFAVDGGSLVNNGTITIGAGIVSGYDVLDFVTNTNLSGSGSIILNGGIITENGTNTVTLSQPIHGWGIIQTSLNSSGNITADVANQTLRVDPYVVVNNSGTLGAINGGNLLLYGTVNGGAITANNGSVSMSGATINGSTLSGGANDLFTVSNTGFNNVTNNARILVEGSLDVSGGSLVNGGAITVGNGATLAFASTTNLNGAGTVTLNGGTLTAPSSGTVELNGGLLINNGTQTGVLNVNYGSTIKGTGTFGTVNITNGGTFSPGNSPGTATVQSLSFQSGGRYQFELNSATAANDTPGDDADLIHVVNQLSLSAGTTPNTQITVALVSLDSNDNPAALSDFDPTKSYRFVLVTSTGINGFNAGEFTVDTSGFTNNLDGGSFSVVPDGNNLDLLFTPVPEPGTWTLVSAGIFVGGLVNWRRKLVRNWTPRMRFSNNYSSRNRCAGTRLSPDRRGASCLNATPDHCHLR